MKLALSEVGLKSLFLTALMLRLFLLPQGTALSASVWLEASV